MSIAGLSWAFATELRPATLKFLLVALGDYADHRGFVYPSIETLCLKTCMDRKTVISGLQQLEELGLLTDSGHRTGRTKQVKVYSLTGLDLGARHYVYRVEDEETGEFYIGVRTCEGAPEHDSAYHGSGTWPLAALRSKRPLRKTILGTYPTRRDAELAELQAINEAVQHQQCRNIQAARTVPPAELLDGRRNGPVGGTVPSGKGPVRGAKQYRPRSERVPPTGHGTLGTLTNEEAATRENRIRVDDPETAAALAERNLRILAELETAAVSAGMGTRLKSEPIANYRLRVLKHFRDQGLTPPTFTEGATP